MIAVRVPATSANLGPGFDALGIAVSLYATVRFERSGSLVITGTEARYCGADNLVYAAYCAALACMGCIGGFAPLFRRQCTFSDGVFTV